MTRIRRALWTGLEVAVEAVVSMLPVLVIVGLYWLLEALT